MGELFVKDDRILSGMVSFTESEFFLNLLPSTGTAGFMHGQEATFSQCLSASSSGGF